jgi:type VI secretion system secreted protein VgrG
MRNLVVNATGATTSVQRNLSTNVGGDCQVAAGGNYAVQATDVSIMTGSASVVTRKNGDIDIKGSAIQIKASRDIVVKGQRILQN